MVRSIFKLAAEGLSNAKIAKNLNNHGVETRNGGTSMWAQSTIGQIIKNRAYLGEAFCEIGGEVFLKENAHPSILSAEEFQSAQRNGQSRKRQPTNDKNTLVGRVICAECGHSMIRATWQRDGESVAGFQCRTKTVDATATCFKSFVLEKDIICLIKNSLEKEVLLLSEQRTKLKDDLILKSCAFKRRESEINRN